MYFDIGQDDIRSSGWVRVPFQSCDPICSTIQSFQQIEDRATFVFSPQISLYYIFLYLIAVMHFCPFIKKSRGGLEHGQRGKCVSWKTWLELQASHLTQKLCSKLRVFMGNSSLPDLLHDCFPPADGSETMRHGRVLSPSVPAVDIGRWTVAVISCYLDTDAVVLRL